MLDPKFVRDNLEAVRSRLADRGLGLDFAEFLKARRAARGFAHHHEHMMAERAAAVISGPSSSKRDDDEDQP